MASTYVPIATTTLGSSQTTVSFSSISSAYTDLVLICQMKLANAPYQPLVRFNSDSGSNYSSTTVYGTGASAGSGRHTNQNGIYANPGSGTVDASQFQTWIFNIMNYANTSTYKTTVERYSNPAAIVNAGVGLWRSTSAINAVSIVAESGSGDFQSGSTFTLYGIKAA